MVIVAGHITVDPEQRESYLAGCMSVVEEARRADGCLDFAITADLLDPGRVDVFERWESQAAVKTFRSSGPSNKQRAAMLSVSVVEYDIAECGPCSETQCVNPQGIGGPDARVPKRPAQAAAPDCDERGPPRWDAQRVIEERARGGPRSCCTLDWISVVVGSTCAWSTTPAS
jgi:quinol monooxygenase YgiN